MDGLPTELQLWIYDHKLPFSAAASSLVSTVAGFPMDSVKSRLQVKKYNSILDCVKET